MWPSDLKRYLETKQSVYWTWTEIAYFVNEMEETPEEDRLPLAEQTWSDIALSVLKTSELSWLISDMPYEFWIFIIMLAFQLLYIANLLVDVWIDFMVEYLGPWVHIVLFLVCVISWPSFFWVINSSCTQADCVIDEHRRTVQFRGVPEKSCTDERIKQFLEEHDWKEEDVPSFRAKGKKLMWELTFANKHLMKDLFKKGRDGARPALATTIEIDNEKVHIGLKLGRSSSSVQFWMECFKYLKTKVPPHFWYRATLSCFVTLSLAARYAKGMRDFAARYAKGMRDLYKLLDYNWLDWFFFSASLMSLLILFFYVGYHAYGDAQDARKAIKPAPEQASSSIKDGKND